MAAGRAPAGPAAGPIGTELLRWPMKPADDALPALTLKRGLLEVNMIWKPNVTVAAVIEQDGKYLLVEEQTDNGILFNQPAGHLESSESLIHAVMRETLEETGYIFVPDSLIGIYNWHAAVEDITFIRFAFSGHASGHDPERPLDAGIVCAEWFTVDE